MSGKSGEQSSSWQKRTAGKCLKKADSNQVSGKSGGQSNVWQKTESNEMSGKNGKQSNTLHGIFCFKTFVDRSQGGTKTQQQEEQPPGYVLRFKSFSAYQLWLYFSLNPVLVCRRSQCRFTNVNGFFSTTSQVFVCMCVCGGGLTI